MSTPPSEDSIVDTHLSQPRTPSLSRYDATLLAIPFPYALLLPVWWYTPLSGTLALFAGSLPAIALMYEALLRRPPVSTEEAIGGGSTEGASERATADD